MLRTCSFSCNSQWQPAQTNIRVRLRLSGTSLYPSCLLVHKSKASLMRFAFIFDRGEHHPRRLSNFAKTVFVKERKSFSFRDSLFCDSFLPQPLLPALGLSALCLPDPATTIFSVFTKGTCNDKINFRLKKGHVSWKRLR